MSRGPPGSVPRSGNRPTHPGVVFASMGCCQPREKMDEKVAKAMYGEMADQAPRKKKEAFCSWCYEWCVHYYIKENTCWLCDACKGRTAESPKCSDNMARLEGTGTSKPVCAKSLPNWEEVCEKKKKTLSKTRNVTKIRYEMTRESPFRHTAQKEGMLRPFLYLVSMSSHHRALLAIQLGWSPFAESSFGDAHEEAWAILNKKGLGLRARCVRGLNKINPFAGLKDWVGVLNHVAETLYVPSYMSWNDEFACDKMDASEGAQESLQAHSKKVDTFEAELMEKVSKQQRSKMNRVQVCTVAQLMQSDNLRKLMAIQQARGVERHTMSLFAIDSCYLQLARDRHLLKGQDADPVEPESLAAAVAQFLSNNVEGDIESFAEAGLEELPSPPPESILNANFEPLWLTLGTLGMRPHSTMARVLPVLVSIFLQKEKLKMAQINIASGEFSK
mmetsp:Transcript_39410/g.93300  ORF Transcript_39410/g.93300 Transcript_39410/m.93300 type:complete len:446 (-) Transcript_39410:173-1510(-)